MNKFLSIFISGLLFLLIGCKSHINKESDLLGNWKIENIETDQQMSSSQKVSFDLYVSQLREASYFTFNKDHKFESFFNDNISNGTWTLVNNGQQLITKTDEEDADTSEIIKLNSTTCIIQSESDGVKTKIVMIK